MIETSERTLDAQASLLCELGRRDGSLSVSDPEVRQRLGPDLEAAIEALVERGLVVLEGNGHLRCGPRGSLLRAREIEGWLEGGSLGRPVEIRSSVTSTNELALERATEGAEPGLVIVAERQSAGRGTRGRSFASAPGLGVWSTTLLAPPEDPEFAPRFSLIAALAVAGAIEAETKVRPAVKWPNDVRIERRKLAGILVEARTRGAALFPVAGIGVNVHHRRADFPRELREQAGSVESATGTRVERGRLLAGLLRGLGELLDADRAGRLDLAERFARFDEMRGREVTVQDGEHIWHGEAVGIETDGSLLLSIPGAGTRAFRSGSATLREKG